MQLLIPHIREQAACRFTIIAIMVIMTNITITYFDHFVFSIVNRISSTIIVTIIGLVQGLAGHDSY